MLADQVDSAGGKGNNRLALKSLFEKLK